MAGDHSLDAGDTEPVAIRSGYRGEDRYLSRSKLSTFGRSPARSDSAFPGALTINGLFCVNESTTYGMLQALRRKRLAGAIKFIGFDSSDPLLVGLKSGEISGLVVQDPFRMGYLGVSTLVKHLRGETVNKFTDTGVTFVTAENLGNPEIVELVKPDLDKWLGKQ